MNMTTEKLKQVIWGLEAVGWGTEQKEMLEEQKEKPWGWSSENKKEIRKDESRE